MMNKKTPTLGKTSTVEGGREVAEENDLKKEKLNQLKKKLFDIYYSKNQKKEKIRKIRLFGFSNKGESKIPNYIILPLSSKKLTWDLFLCLVILFQSWFIPLDLGFNQECFLNATGVEVMFIFTVTTFVLFFIDIGLTFFTALENEKGEYVYDLKQIAISYISKTFLIEVAANFPFEYMISFSNNVCWTTSISTNKYMLIVRFVRIIKLVKINDIIEKHTPANLISIVRLLKIILFYFLIIHIMGSIFTSKSQTMIDLIPDSVKNGKSMQAFIELYSLVVFVGIYLILGNDMAFKTLTEKIMVIIINVIALITNANIFGYIAVTLKNSSVGASEDLNLERIENINDFLNYQEINDELKLDIKNYYLLMYKRQRDLYYGKNIFDDLSNCLKVIAKFEYWKANYFAFDTLFISCSSEFLADSLLVMRAKMFLVNERIVYEGESSTDFYFVPSGGKCAVIIHGNRVKVLKEGEYFGETACFLSSEKRTASVDSLNLSDILYIPGKDFVNLLRNHQDEAEYLRSVAMSNFYNTIALTRISLATQLFPKNTRDPLFKPNLYDDGGSEEIQPLENEKR